ncbi:MAG TPA: tetratricopeptide repeat protein, partial [bacterium]
LTGTGFGTFEAAYPSYRPLSLMMRQSQRSYEVDQAHNWVLEWAAETGLVGLALLIWFWVMILFQWWKLFSANAIPRALGAGVFAAFAGIAANNLFDVNSHLPTTLVPLLFLAAFPVALSNRFHHLEGFPIRISEFDLSKTSIYLLPVVVLVAASSIHQIKTSFENQLADIQLKNAMTLSQQKKWDEAIPVYDRVLQLDKNNVMAMYFRGSAYFDRGNPGDNEKALWDYWAVSSIQPDYVLIHFKKAQVLDRLGKPEESKKEMKRAISLDPQLIFQVGEFKKAGQLAAAGKFTDAFDIYQKMVFDYPTCVPLLVDEGSCWVRLKKYRPAIAVYKTALGLDPQNQEAHQNLAAVQNLKEAGN